jgi:hypothetical protein
MPQEFIRECPCPTCMAGRREFQASLCMRCDQPLGDALTEVHPYSSAVWSAEFICSDCLPLFTQCYMCDRWDYNDEVIRPVDQTRRNYCRVCATRNLICCNDCGVWARFSDQPDYCNDCAPASLWHYDEENDYDDDGDGLIHSYSYTPYPLTFYGDGPAYLGMELEISTYDSEEIARAIHSKLGDQVYCKYDGSVSGIEMVTHPMSHEYLQKEIDWSFLDDLERRGCDAEDNGIHVHISRAAFDSPAHVYRWMRLIYRNRRAVQRIARRSGDQWASFSSHDRAQFKEFAKGDHNGERYSAINVQNNNTFEVRIFRGSLNRREVMAALDLVAASVEYTRNLTVPAIMNGGWTWDGFMSWAEDDERYTALVEESRERV